MLCRKIWFPPPRGWFKLSVHGSYRMNMGGCGGVLRDRRGKFIRGFQIFLPGVRTSLKCQLWGIYVALRFLYEKFLVDKVIVEVDCCHALRQICNLTHVGRENSDIIFAIRELMVKMNFPIRRIRRVSREANTVADCLARTIRQEAANGLWYYRREPSLISRLIQEDIRRYAKYLRKISRGFRTHS